jgi:hypothetical protein
MIDWRGKQLGSENNKKIAKKALLMALTKAAIIKVEYQQLFTESLRSLKRKHSSKLLKHFERRRLLRNLKRMGKKHPENLEKRTFSKDHLKKAELLRNLKKKKHLENLKTKKLPKKAENKAPIKILMQG